MVMRNMDANDSISVSSSFVDVSSSASDTDVSAIKSSKGSKDKITDSDIEYVVDRYSEALKLLSE